MNRKWTIIKNRLRVADLAIQQPSARVSLVVNTSALLATSTSQVRVRLYKKVLGIRLPTGEIGTANFKLKSPST